MSRARFNVTYDIVTPESAEHSDTDECGFIEEGATLRDAISAVLRGRTRKRDSGDGASYDGDNTVIVGNGMEFETGAYETRYLHIPELVTGASARRIARLAGAKVK
jgi:hypothetical protein